MCRLFSVLLFWIITMNIILWISKIHQLSQNRLSLGIHVKCTLIRISLSPPKTFSCRIFICNAKWNKSIWPSYHAKQKSFVKWEIKLFIHNMFVCFMTYSVSSCNEIDIGKELWNVTHKCTTHPKDLQVCRSLQSWFINSTIYILVTY